MPNAEVRTTRCEPTIVRGCLFLPQSLAPSPQSLACLLDIAGRKVMDLHAGANDVRALAPGVYFVRPARGEGRMANTKVVITR
jgi:hypothetical protein